MEIFTHSLFSTIISPTLNALKMLLTTGQCVICILGLEVTQVCSTSLLLFYVLNISEVSR